MKNIFVLIFSLNSLSLCAQELNIGSNLGYKFIKDSQAIYRGEKNALTLGGVFEFRPKHAIFSLNAEARCFFEKKIIVQFPIYLKFIIGNKVRFCPSLGAFWISTGNYGGSLGLNFEVPLSEKMCIFTRYEFYLEGYEESIPSHFGNAYKSIANREANWIGIGIKHNLL
jgi:hypothetical protein